jgi:hypothetical protein
MKLRILLSLTALLCCFAATAPATVLTGQISQLTGVAVIRSTFVRFELQNCGNNIPRVTGRSAFVPSTQDFIPNGAGTLIGNIAGNDAITCDTAGQTYYRVTVWNGNVKQYSANFYVQGVTWDITQAQALGDNPSGNITSQLPVPNTILHGSGSPLTANGTDGDFYIDTTNKLIYGPKIGGSWPNSGVSMTGTPGSNGNTILSGFGAPSNSNGNDGDFYLNLTSEALFGPKQSGAWPGSGVSLVGPTGSGGSGASIQFTTPPASSSSTCNVGTFAVDNNYYYVCSATNTWKTLPLTSFPH